MTSDQPWWLSMSPAEVAARILPWFTSRKGTTEEVVMKDIATWLKTGKDSLGGFREHNDKAFKDPDMRAVAEAIQILEHASLLMQVHGNVGLTRLGMHALQTNTVRQHLGLGEAPPTG